MADRYFAHQELIKRTKLLLTKTYPKRLRIFDRHVGLFYKKRTDNNIINYSPIKINKKGMCDCWGVMAVPCEFRRGNLINLPIHLEMEFKTGNAKLSEEQKNWRDFCNSMGWLWFEVRDENQFMLNLNTRFYKMGLI